VSQAETDLGPSPGYAAGAAALSIHLVSHTHWDREWYLPFEVFRAKLVRLVDELLDILESEPGFNRFMLDGQTIVIDDYLALRPANAGLLRALVKSGRLLVGPWYVLPDEALVGGESLVRNLARGIRRARELGGPMPVGYVPDQFGHSSDLPTILRGFGLADACLWRGVGEDVGSSLFRWRAPSGAEVLVAYLATSYSNAAGFPEDPGEAGVAMEQAVEALRPYLVVPACLLMNGTDHQFPRRGVPRALGEAARRSGIAEARMSSLPDYMADARKSLKEAKREIPLVEGELRSGFRAPLLVGTLSARIRQKQRNYRLEELLTRRAEPVAAMARLTGAEPYPTPELDHAWELLLQNHPHDSICGCSIDVVHREIETRFDKAEQVAASVLSQALEALRGYLSPGPGVVTVVNPSPFRTGGLVEAVIPGGPGASDGAAAPQVLLDEDGRPVLLQDVAGGGEDVVFEQTVTPRQLKALLPFVSGREVMGMFINGLNLTRPSPGLVRVELIIGDRPVGEVDVQAGREAIRKLLADRSVSRFHAIARRSPERRVIFIAEDVPGLGWRQYRLVPGDVAPPRTGPIRTGGDRAEPAPAPAAVTGPRSLDNGLVSVALEPDGTLIVTDGESGRTVRGLHRLIDGGDRGDLYNHCPPEKDTLVDRPVRRVRLRAVEHGPVRATLEVTDVYRLPRGLTPDRRARRGGGWRGRRDTAEMTVVTRVSLVAGERLVRLRTAFDNRVEDHRLIAVFPTPEPFDTHHALGHFSVLARPAREPVTDSGAWAELPSGTWPNLGFFGAGGLTVFTRGLPEYGVAGGGAAAPAACGLPGHALFLTLVRSVGWLSRDDLATRPGHAGPGVPTPEGQSQGPHELEYALAVHPGRDWRAAGVVGLHRAWCGGLTALPDVITPDLESLGRATGDGHHRSHLDTRSLLELTEVTPGGARMEGAAAPASVVATAVNVAGEGSPERLVVRVANLSDQPAHVEAQGASRSEVQGDGALTWRRLDLAGNPMDASHPAPPGRILLDPWEVLTLGLAPEP